MRMFQSSLSHDGCTSPIKSKSQCRRRNRSYRIWRNGKCSLFRQKLDCHISWAVDVVICLTVWTHICMCAHACVSMRMYGSIIIHLDVCLTDFLWKKSGAQRPRAHKKGHVTHKWFSTLIWKKFSYSYSWFSLTHITRSKLFIHPNGRHNTTIPIMYCHWMKAITVD